MNACPFRRATFLVLGLPMLLVSSSGAGQSSSEKTLALVGGTIYPSPEEEAVETGVVLVRNGRIAAVGAGESVDVPEDATVIRCEGAFVVAGFQNSHVHFTEPKWENSATLPEDRLSAQMEEMLLKFGFTTVVDTGSFLLNTIALRRRIESGEVRGPRIFTAGTPLYPQNGIPYYLRDELPPEILPLLPTPGTEEEAARIVAEQIAAGADIVKLFTGSWVERGRVLPMSEAIARAAAAEAHRHRKPVFSHASSIAGLQVALAAGVDVLAHALDDDRGWNEAHVSRMKANGMAMVPTLKLFGGQRYTQFIQKEVSDYAGAGGQILFGTDVGYLSDYDPSEEYASMAGAGLDWREILASLTTAPAERFGESARRGRIAPGMDADIVVLRADPAKDVTAFARVQTTMRGGRIVYTAGSAPANPFGSEPDGLRARTVTRYTERRQSR